MINIDKTTAKYLVLDLNTYEMREEEKGPTDDPALLNDDKCRTTELWLRRIEPGTFTMGSPHDELGRYDDEIQHQVTLTKAYYIGVFEMTQKQCQNIFGVNPSKYKGDLRPVESVSYNMIRGSKKGAAWPENHGVDERSFMGQLRKKAGNIFDLPTEAQWEFACRAGTEMALNSGKDLSDDKQCDEMAEVGRYWCNGGVDKDDDGDYIAHAKVGSYLPNAWGLYDMHGNVYEWCLDWYQSDLDSAPATDPNGAFSWDYRILRGGGREDIEDYYRSKYRSGSGPATEQPGGSCRFCRVLRGGSWDGNASNCRSAFRGCYNPGRGRSSFGFRVVLVQ